MKNSTTFGRFFVACLLFASSTATSQLPVVNLDKAPSGASVGVPSGNKLYIDQLEDRAIIHWDSFSIGKGNQVIFNQAQHQAVLNRVLGDGRSDLEGVLEAGGTVWLINPNGVLIGKDARIATQSFLASTLDIPSDSAFLAPDTAHFTFMGESSASIINQGKVEARGGDVVLIARHVNNQGELHAQEGGVLLAAGNEVEITMLPSHPLNSRIAVKSTLPSTGAVGVNHEGIIQAAQAEIAAAGGNVYSFAVNVGGSVKAHGNGSSEDASITLASEGGKIRIVNNAQLIADAGYITVDADQGQISIDGELDVRSSVAADWGQIYIRAEHIDVLGNSRLDASNGSGEAGSIELSRARHDTDSRVRVHKGAVITADGNDGYLSVDASSVSLAGTIRADNGWLSLHAGNIQSAGASIQTGAMALYGVQSADISGPNNSIRELHLAAGHYPVSGGNLYVDAGSGSLDVFGEGEVRYRNLKIINQGDLRFGEYAASIGVTEEAVLASLEGKLHIEVPDYSNLIEAERIRLYSREESELIGLVPDSVFENVVFPEDPDNKSHVVLYRIIDGPVPGQPDSDTSHEAIVKSFNRDVAHQQQAFGGAGFSPAENSSWSIDSEGRVIRQAGEFDTLIEIQRVVEELYREVMARLTLIQAGYSDEDGGEDPTDLFFKVLDAAVRSGRVAPELTEQIIAMFNGAARSRDFDLDRDRPETDRSVGVGVEAEQQRRGQELRQQTEQRRSQQQQEREEHRQQVADNQDAVEWFQQRREQQQEENERRGEERQQSSEEQRRQIEERRNAVEQEADSRLASRNGPEPGSEAAARQSGDHEQEDGQQPEAQYPAEEDRRAQQAGSRMDDSGGRSTEEQQDNHAEHRSAGNGDREERTNTEQAQYVDPEELRTKALAAAFDRLMEALQGDRENLLDLLRGLAPELLAGYSDEGWDENSIEAISNILNSAARSGRVAPELIEQLTGRVYEAVGGSPGYDLNSEVPDTGRRAGVDVEAEQQRRGQELRQQTEQRRSQLQQEREERRQQAEDNQDVVERFQQTRQQQQEENERSGEERQQEAEDRHLRQLSEEQRRQLEERRNAGGTR